MPIKNIQTSHLVHDLKNPINIIETGARALLEKTDRYGKLEPKQEKVVRRLLRNALKIKNLAASMLEVDMASHGIVKSCECQMMDIIKNALLEVFDLVDPALAEDLEETSDFRAMKEFLERNNIVLEAKEADISKTIRTDDTKLCLVITNLLSNALKYKTKTVTIGCVAQNDEIRLSVQDDGPGIPENFHNQIFDQYFQCVTVEGFPVRGHGLGLAGAQALTEALGGKLSLGAGATGAEFVVSIKASTQ
jgi:hypothetical protein